MLRGSRDGRRRRRAGTPFLVVHVSVPAVSATDDASSPCPRVGLVVSRAVGNAVVRNRTSRRLRSLVRERLKDLPDGTDLVVRALPPAAAASTQQLAGALDEGLARVMERVA
ncbi:Ribonuclease P protein component [Serinicoccus hydrothermalis]|uniref:Ribonuclease P protein component n=1 Tax=Serinicoccus hydrothermalis TaxID=1758689 RepID=A0A1B1NCT8_9MICO|nr:ribonuclease P protein component [Serinicoccus hydrothermalis]ANS79270.1 Ribonuclease P protein component [Serinicoccus hydrothermalis]